MSNSSNGLSDEQLNCSSTSNSISQARSSPAEFQAEPPLSMSGEDWRTQLLPDSRQKIVNKILATLSRHLPVSGEEGLQELGKIAARFEEKVYNSAISQSDYLRKISLKMLTMESKSQNASGSSASLPPFPSNTRLHELEKIADKIEQNMRIAVVSQPDYIRRTGILENAFSEFKSQNTVHNDPASSSIGVNADPQEPAFSLLQSQIMDADYPF